MQEVLLHCKWQLSLLAAAIGSNLELDRVTPSALFQWLGLKEVTFSCQAADTNIGFNVGRGQCWYRTTVQKSEGDLLPQTGIPAFLPCPSAAGPADPKNQGNHHESRIPKMLK